MILTYKPLNTCAICWARELIENAAIVSNLHLSISVPQSFRVARDNMSRVLNNNPNVKHHPIFSLIWTIHWMIPKIQLNLSSKGISTLAPPNGLQGKCMKTQFSSGRAIFTNCSCLQHLAFFFYLAAKADRELMKLPIGGYAWGKYTRPMTMQKRESCSFFGQGYCAGQNSSPEMYTADPREKTNLKAGMGFSYPFWDSCT